MDVVRHHAPLKQPILRIVALDWLTLNNRSAVRPLGYRLALPRIFKS